MSNRKLKELMRRQPAKTKAPAAIDSAAFTSALTPKNVEIPTDANAFPLLDYTIAQVAEGKRLANMLLTMVPESVRILGDGAPIIFVDYDYQPDLNKARVRHIESNWNNLQCRPGVLNEREDGTLAVIDGQHTLSAAKLKAIPFLLFTVYRGKDRLTYKQEAWLLRELNSRKNRRAPSKDAEYRSEIAEGTELGRKYKKIDAVLANTGFHRGGAQKNRLSSLESTVDSFDLDGTGASLQKALFTIKHAWLGMVAVPGNMVRAVAGLHNNVGNLIMEDHLRKTLSKRLPSGNTPDTWINAVRLEYGAKPIHREMPGALAGRILDEYNNNLKSKRLPKTPALADFTMPGAAKKS